LISFKSVPAQTDSILQSDTAIIRSVVIDTYQKKLDKLLEKNNFLNADAAPVSLAIKQRHHTGYELVFYSIIFLLLLFGLLKTFYSRYLNNLIRVFFNTSLRQNQLTDQLLQSTLPSLFFNVFFVLIAGFYVYFLLDNYDYIDAVEDQRILLLIIAAIAIVYAVKYCVLKFTGWVSGYKQEADTYIFIVFLINKIIAIALLPVIIIMAFSEPWLVNALIIISYLVIFTMLIFRFLRSWSILQTKVRVKRYHFFLYIIGIEIMPLLLIYKTAMDFLKNNL
jgi:hypothetical protein